MKDRQLGDVMEDRMVLHGKQGGMVCALKDGMGDRTDGMEGNGIREKLGWDGGWYRIGRNGM